MSVFKAIILCFGFQIINTADDYSYCQLYTSSPVDFYATTTTSGGTTTTTNFGISDVLVAQNPTNGDDLINLGSTSLLYSRSSLNSDLTYPATSTSLIDTAFCNGGKMYSADVNGDGYDDVICLESIGSFTYKRYIPRTKTYASIETLTTAAQFTCAAGSKVIIGNFDGKGPDEIICIPTSATGFSAAVMYAPADCSSAARAANILPIYHQPYVHTGHAFGPHLYPGFGSQHLYPTAYYYGHRHARHIYNYECPSGTSYTVASLLNCDPSADDIVVGVIGTGTAEGLFCHLAADSSIKYYPGSTTLSSSMFGAGTDIAGVGTTCVHATHKLLAADVDGDRDSDLVCVHGKVDDTAPGESKISFQKSTGVFDAFNFRSTPCLDFCTDTSSGVKPDAVRQSPPFWHVLDFDGDGRDDIMCKYTYTNGQVFLQASIARPFQ